MCRLEHWLCCICEDAYVALNFFCVDVAPGAPTCPNTTRYERHIAARYCYFCSNVGHGGAPLPSRTKEYLDNLASLEGMLRVAARTDRDDVTVSVFSNWLMGFYGPKNIRPFAASHPAIHSDSTKDHFARNLSPPQKVASFILTSSEISRASAFIYQTAIVSNLTAQPCFQPPAMVPEQGQPSCRTDKGVRRWSNRTHRMMSAEMEQQSSSSSWPSSSHTSPRDAIYASWEDSSEPWDTAKPDVTMPNRKRLPISFIAVDDDDDDDIDVRVTASSNDLKGRQIVAPLASTPTFAGNNAKPTVDTVDHVQQPVAMSYVTVTSSDSTAPVISNTDNIRDDRTDKQGVGKLPRTQRPTRSPAIIPVIPLVPIVTARTPRGPVKSRIASTPRAVTIPIVTSTVALTQTKAEAATPTPTSPQVVVSAEVNVEKENAKARTSKSVTPKDTAAAPREEDEQKNLPVFPEVQKKPLLYSQAIATNTSPNAIPTGPRGHFINHTESQDEPKKKDLTQKRPKNSRPKRKGQKQKRGQKKQQQHTQEQEPKPEQNSGQEPEHHQFRLPSLSYRDALKGSPTGNDILPSSS
ncbi:hypothetical protein F5Y00DRAFT_87423 [Daldinia vernicosa]|uniref:uncharacterized protein n=1 Tax=Daldinia vernicosa TaxID=114800 RepID=UPI002007B7C5|nr:uncharacterized protein F5Y00DRAFT_87423 [Daldinia vernicosa]KAI0848513.1 hypothetical protein F5Y00DRAFT_87423 [Daldinia vernicosa]